jgi:membrane-associated phospholipid phosphatase
MLELNRPTSPENLLLDADADRSFAERARSAVSRLNVIDRLTLAYVGFTSLLLVCSPHDVPGRARMLAVHAALVALVALLAYHRRPQPAGWWRKVLNFLSHWYPIALPAYFFEEIHSLVHVVFRRWFDAPVIALDYAMFGAHPTVWFEQHASYWVTEAMNFAYFSYWPLVPGLAALLWVSERGRGRRVEFETFALSLCVAYYLCYVVFILFPVEGPYHTLRHLQQVHAMPGWVFTHAVEFVEKYGRIHGGALPSAHVAGSVVALVAAFRRSKKLGWAVAPLVVGVMVSAVYGRYHYAADIWAGALVGAVGCWAGSRLMRRKVIP